MKNKILLFSVLGLFFWSNPKAQNSATLGFIENRGQLFNQNGEPREDILFYTNHNGLSIFLGGSGFHYQINSSVSETDNSQLEIDFNTARVDIRWLNANEPIIERFEKMKTMFHYQNMPSDKSPVMNARSYQIIRYVNVYDNIDLVFKISEERGVEYDFIVHPGGNPANIQLEVAGAELSVSDRNELMIQTPLGIIVEGELMVYQNGKTIDSKWQVNKNIVRYAINEAYDQNEELVIDPPVRLWGTYLGGNQYTRAKACGFDSNDNSIVYGETQATNIATSGAFQSNNGGVQDLFIGKFDQNGVPIWITYYGGPGQEIASGIAMDSGDNIYVCGQTNSSSSFATAGAHQSVFGGGNDAFLAKFSPLGSLLWCTYYGAGTTFDYGRACAVDLFDNVFLVGETNSGSGIATPGAYQTSLGGGGLDGFIAKFDQNGTRLLGTYFGGAQKDEIFGCEVGGLTGGIQSLHIVGRTQSPNQISTSFAQQVDYGGVRDAFLAKFSLNLGPIWSTYVGGSEDDDARDCTVLASGDIVIVGRTMSPSDIATTTGYNTGINGGFDGYIRSYDSNGALQWGTYIGSAASDLIKSCDADNAGGFYFVGNVGGTINIPAALDPYEGNYQGGVTDVVFGRMSFIGNLDHLSYYGGSGDEDGSFISADNQGFILSGSTTGSETDIASQGAYVSSLNTATDAFLVKMSNCTASGITVSANGLNPACIGGAIILNCTPTGLSSIFWEGPNEFSLNNSDSFTIPNVTEANEGYYIATATDANGCTFKDSVFYGVEEISTVDLTVTTIGATLTSNASGPYDYQWIDCGTNAIIPNENGQSFTAQANGNYAVQITDPGACYVTTDCFSVLTVGIDTVNVNYSLLLYPNPATNMVSVSSNGINTLELLDVSGKLIRAQTVTGERTDIDISSLPSGFYIIRGISRDVVFRTERLMKH